MLLGDMPIFFIIYGLKEFVAALPKEVRVAESGSQLILKNVFSDMHFIEQGTEAGHHEEERKGSNYGSHKTSDVAQGSEELEV